MDNKNKKIKKLHGGSTITSSTEVFINYCGPQIRTETKKYYWMRHIYQLVGSKPVSYLQAWPKSCTRDYQGQIQLAVRTGNELAISVL